MMIAVATVTAQSKDCSIGKTKFPCSANWTDIISEGNGPFVAKYKDSNVTLFASTFSGATTDEAIDNVLIGILSDGLSVNKDTLRIKLSDDYWDESKYSKFEEIKGGRVIFDPGKDRMSQIHYCIFSYSGSKYIAGFSRAMHEGNEAEARYDAWIGGGGDGDTQLRELIFAITNEKRGSDLPGGPPPAMPLPGGPPPAG